MRLTERVDSPDATLSEDLVLIHHDERACVEYARNMKIVSRAERDKRRQLVRPNKKQLTQCLWRQFAEQD